MSVSGKGKKNDTSEGAEVVATPVPTAPPTSDKLKIAFLDTFTGDRKKLKSFLIQTEFHRAADGRVTTTANQGTKDIFIS
ncbi:hypothetical protein VE00_10292 [Pseudogymnoascus sp. WSF 3629]|nr:hypothetical protein VE00_10292 [Pseudogymnoascus sp. WSF 3629]